MRFPLKRFYQDERQTLGTLLVGKRLLFTIERPWIHNQPFNSCFPPGAYQMKEIEIDDRPKVRLEQINYFGKAERTLLNIEVSNWAHQLQGCVGIGTGVQIDQALSDENHALIYMVTSSQIALGDLLEEMQRWDDVPMYLDVDNP